MRGYMGLGASRQRQKIVADVLMAAARRSTGGPVPRKDEPTAPTSGKHRPVGRVPFGTLSSPTEHGPGQIPVPHTRRPGPFSPKASGATMGAMLDSCWRGNTAVPSRLHMCRAGATLPQQLGQPGDVDGDAASLVVRQRLRLQRLGFVLAAVEVGVPRQQLPMTRPVLTGGMDGRGARRRGRNRRRLNRRQRTSGSVQGAPRANDSRFWKYQEPIAPGRAQPSLGHNSNRRPQARNRASRRESAGR
jgi:hypothetical protein